MALDVKQIGEKVAQESQVIDRIRTELHEVIVGQEMLVDRGPDRRHRYRQQSGPAAI
jgi:hypothetical protein